MCGGDLVSHYTCQALTANDKTIRRGIMDPSLLHRAPILLILAVSARANHSCRNCCINCRAYGGYAECWRCNNLSSVGGKAVAVPGTRTPFRAPENIYAILFLFPICCFWFGQICANLGKKEVNSCAGSSKEQQPLNFTVALKKTPQILGKKIVWKSVFGELLQKARKKWTKPENPHWKASLSIVFVNCMGHFLVTWNLRMIPSLSDKKTFATQDKTFLGQAHTHTHTHTHTISIQKTLELPSNKWKCGSTCVTSSEAWSQAWSKRQLRLECAPKLWPEPSLLAKKNASVPSKFPHSSSEDPSFINRRKKTHRGDTEKDSTGAARKTPWARIISTTPLMKMSKTSNEYHCSGLVHTVLNTRGVSTRFYSRAPLPCPGMERSHCEPGLGKMSKALRTHLDVWEGDGCENIQ